MQDALCWRRADGASDEQKAAGREVAMIGGRPAFAWLALAALSVPQPAAAQDFYAGKTLKIVVGLEAGGTVDAAARLFAPHLRKHIPGHPTIVIQNMPSAAGVRPERLSSVCGWRQLRRWEV